MFRCSEAYNKNTEKNAVLLLISLLFNWLRPVVQYHQLVFAYAQRLYLLHREKKTERKVRKWTSRLWQLGGGGGVGGGGWEPNTTQKK
jgi:hypothetical protein